MNPVRVGTAALVLALFSLVGCQDVQPDSTLGAALAQTDMNEAAETDTESEMKLDLRLEALQQSRPDVMLQTRNPFSFGSASSRRSNVREAVSAPVLPEPAGMNPPIPAVVRRVRLRMIGLVEAAITAARIAVLTDGDVVLHGQEGDVVDGRYRIIAITSTSVEIESIEDGSHQVLRLAGS